MFEPQKNRPEYKNFTYLCIKEQVVNKNRKIKLLKNAKTN